MSITRAPRPTSNFYLLDKKISEDKRLSWAARGILIFLLGKPDYWTVSPAALTNETKGLKRGTGRDGVYAILKELADVGYLQIADDRDASGSFAGTNYTVSETPVLATIPDTVQPDTVQPDTVQPDTVQPDTVQPDTVQPDTANPPQVSIEPVLRIDPEQEKKKQEAPVQKISFDGMRFGNLSSEQVEFWRQAYPAANVDGEILKAAAWLDANPKNLKSDYKRFLSGWMSRAQDKAPAIGYTQGHAAPAAQRPQAPRYTSAAQATAERRAATIAGLTGRDRQQQPQGQDHERTIDTQARYI